VVEIFPDLTARTAEAGVDLTKAKRLLENRDVAFMGDTKGGGFDISGVEARGWLTLPRNPSRKPNSDVLKPWINGLDVTRRNRDMWIVDFGWEMSEAEAALYERPFAHVREHVFPERQKNRREAYKKFWWRHVEARQGMHAALANASGYIATPTVAKHRRVANAARSPTHRHRLRRRDDLWDSALTLSRAVVVAHVHLARSRERPALHADHML
jgi:type II restriction/modification system DNA methylase subunit YeeA